MPLLTDDFNEYRAINMKPKFRSTLVKHFYKFLSNKKLLRILSCQNFRLP